MKLDVRTKLDQGYYKNVKPYPENKCTCGIHFKPLNDGNNFCGKCGADIHQQRETILKVREECRKEEGRLNEEFSKDALEEVGLKGHPKADKAFSWAWEHGHGSGYHDVLCYLYDAAELILDKE
jgi:hypothetical protein